MRRLLLPGLLLGLVAAAGWWGAEVARGTSWVTGDEPDHVRACRELRSGPGVISNFEHPVLMKLIGAAGLPASKEERFVDETRAARRLFPPLLGLLAAISGLWAWKRSGAAAGLAISALLVVEPMLRGHAPLVHSDLLLTAFLTAAAAALDLSGSPRCPKRALLVLSGALYGLALVSKYSALPFLPVFLVAATVRLRGLPPRRLPPPAKGRRARARFMEAESAPWRSAAAKVLLLIGLPALVVAGSVQQATVSLSTARSDLVSGVERKFHGFPYHAEALDSARSLPEGAAAYIAGLLWVRASAGPGVRYNYFFGKASGTGFPLYFPVSLALKLTTASVALLAGFLVALVPLLGRAGRRRRRLLRLLAARSALPAFLGAAYLGAAMASNVNIGVRHVMPSVPLFLVAAAGAVRSLGPRRRSRRAALLAIVVVLAAGESWAFRGREIPFGNLLAGGPSGLRRVLSDSNVDWGEAQGVLFDRVRRRDLGRVGVVSLFFDPEEARRAGAVQIDSFSPGEFDAVFVSVFLEDLAPALERNSESWPKFRWARSWLPALVSSVRRGASSREPFGDEYVLYRITAPGPAAPSPTSPSR